MAKKAIIVGAGPVGLSLALGLAHYGVRSVLLEKKERPDQESKASGIHARTLEILRAWGALEDFLAEGFFAPRFDLWSAEKKKKVASLDLSSLKQKTGLPGVLILPQNRTEAILRKKVEESGLCEICFGHEVIGFQQEENGVRVTVRAKAEYKLKGSFLFGCDGAHSTIREKLGWQLEGKTYPAHFLLADVTFGSKNEDLPWPRIARSRGVLAAIKIEKGLWRIISTLDEKEENPEINPRVEALFGPTHFETIWQSVFRIHCRTSPHFRRGKILLLGDAAHINSPAGGQGMNSGIQDAHNLAWKIKNILEGGAEEALLASYEEERRPVILNSVDRWTDFLTRAVLLSAPRMRTAFLLLAQFFLPLLMKKIAPRIAMLDSCYSSRLISGLGPFLGCRAPDGELRDLSGKDLRLLDLVNDGPALLLFDDGRLPRWDLAWISEEEKFLKLPIYRILPKWIGAQKGDLKDAGGKIWKDWKAQGGMAALIRPDGHVGWVGRRPEPEGLRVGVSGALGLPQLL